MAAPEYVPTKPGNRVRVYRSPPREKEPWYPDRPGELEGGQPRGDRLGNQGPDQGYALALARRFEGKLTLADGEHEADALAGAVAIALKRASLLGRAPVIHDLTVALTVWGFLRDAPADLVDLRRTAFAEVSSPARYVGQRQLVDMVPESTLRMTPAAVADAATTDWRSLLEVAVER
jgi:hypothetical protein